MEKQIRYDTDGYEILTPALRELVNQYPGLRAGDEIAFSTLGEDSGKAMFATSGGIIETERVTVTGRVKQVCLYPFTVIYRVEGPPEDRKAAIKEWLDDLGRWLEGQPISIEGTTYTLMRYPTLTGSRKFLSISRQTPGYLDSVNENHIENWAIHLSARYQNEFTRTNLFKN